jgi:Ser/Thr protein kinase RdoA (MazF antagonist)
VTPADLTPWGSPRVAGRLGGGHRNEVWELDRGGDRLVARRVRRSPAELDWELDLMAHLAEHDFRVPATVYTVDGRRHAGGVVVQTWVPGGPPEPGDWPAVAAELRRLHELTPGYPQRPGFAGVAELLTTDRGGDVDLSAMPPDAAADCRAAWRRLPPAPLCVVHGDPGAANIRVSGGRVGFVDWDESRTDHPDLDLADLPVPVLPPARHQLARAAGHAWEAANGWRLEPAYARRRLAALRA